MKRRLINYLYCPECRGKITLEQLTVFEELDSEILSGIITCACGQYYPIMGMVPVMLTGELRGDYSDFIKEHGRHVPDSVHEKCEKETRKEKNQGCQVKESFGYKWQLLENYGFEGPSKDFTDRWMYEGYGWIDEQTYIKEMNTKTAFLDAGCGLGREVDRFCRANNKALAIGLELSDCARIAYQKVKDFPNAHIIQADIMNLPLAGETFDLILSEGVLHHTPDTRAALFNLCDCLVKGGEIAIYIYIIKPLLRELADEYIRSETTQLTQDRCWEVCRHFTRLGQTLQGIDTTFTVDKDIPIIGIEKGTYTIQEFIYRYFMKCFWNKTFTFDENNLVNFDWYHPRYAFRHTPEQLTSWAGSLGLTQKWFRTTQSGMFFRAIKE
ncbi:MAG TPA: methyltransferase domain-containing protein [Deltaproteobacteria bacterium]|nr:methyltransferase domain-containing protein [Deltaproteobacteria bacterium]